MTDWPTRCSRVWQLSPCPVVFLLVIAVGATIGLVNGFFVAKFKLHPFIVTLSTQLIVYGTILLYLKMGDNNGQTLSGLSEGYRNLIAGPLFTIGRTLPCPSYVLYAVILTALMWIIWNKTTFGKNMFAVGSNEEAAKRLRRQRHRHHHSGVRAGRCYVRHHRLHRAARASPPSTANTGLNYELRRHCGLRHRRRLLRRWYR